VIKQSERWNESAPPRSFNPFVPPPRAYSGAAGVGGVEQEKEEHSRESGVRGDFPTPPVLYGECYTYRIFSTHRCAVVIFYFICVWLHIV
jgi:hypothetical protein